MKKIISITSVLLIVSLFSYADFETGNSLLEKLEYFPGYDVNKLTELEYTHLVLYTHLEMCWEYMMLTVSFQPSQDWHPIFINLLG